MLDNRREQMLLVDHPNDGEEHHQQRGKRQCLFKGMTNTVLVSHTVECRLQHNNGQTNQAHRRQMQRQTSHQKYRHNTLHYQLRFFGATTLGILIIGIVFEYAAHRIRQFRAVIEEARHFQHDAGEPSHQQYRHTHRCHHDEEVRKLPAHFLGDQQILRLADQSADTPQGGPYGAVHQQAAQKRAELLQIMASIILHTGIFIVVVIGMGVMSPGGHSVVDRVKPHADGNQYRRDGQCIKKSA